MADTKIDDLETELSEEYFLSSLYVKDIFKDRNEYFRKCIFIDQSSFCESCADRLAATLNKEIKKKFRYRIAKAKKHYGEYETQRSHGFLVVPKIACDCDECASGDQGPIICAKCNVPLIVYIDAQDIEREMKNLGFDEAMIETVVERYNSMTDFGTIRTQRQYDNAMELFQEYELWDF